MHNPKSKRLGDIINFKRGYDLPSYNRVEGNYPIISSSGISGYHSEYKVDGEGLVTGRYGTLGEMYYVNGKYWPHNTALYVTDFKGNYAKYVYYLMKCLGNLKTSDKSTVPGINRNDLHEIIVPFLSHEFQKPIADFLFQIDTKIELNNRINAELEAMAKTLYDYWFVQFDFPDANGKPFKTSGGKMVWSEELKREVPDGWRIGELSDIADLIRGVSYDKTDIKTSDSKGVVPILRATNVSGNVIDLQNMVYVTEGNVSTKQFLNKYDILITMSSGSIDHIGKNGFFYFDSKVSYGTFCAKLVARDNYRFYLYSYTQSDFMFQTIKNECLGTNINNLNSSLVNGFKIVIPANHLVSEFNTRVSNAFEKIGNNIKENQKLAELRDWLLPMLMNGQVKVK